MIPTVCVLATMNYGLATQCQFVPMLDRRVALDTGEELVIGKLTAEGKFKTTSQLPTRYGIIIYSGPPFTLLNGSEVIARPLVYNLDGKQLVPGRVTEHGTFTADPNGKAISFAEYEFSATAPPIWNLPGRFLPLGIDPDKRPVTPLSKSAVEGLMKGLQSNGKPVPPNHSEYGGGEPAVCMAALGNSHEGAVDSGPQAGFACSVCGKCTCKATIRKILSENASFWQ